jgi:hypothetical protein
LHFDFVPLSFAISSKKVFDYNGDLIGRFFGKYFTSPTAEEQSMTFAAGSDAIKVQHAKFIIPPFHQPYTNPRNY